MPKPLNILLVEDDVVDVMNVRRAFQKQRIANPLYVVGNGAEALDFLRHRGAFSDPATAPRPGIILLDLNSQTRPAASADSRGRADHFGGRE